MRKAPGVSRALFLYQHRLLPTKRFLARKMKSETEGHVIVVKGSL